MKQWSLVTIAIAVVLFLSTMSPAIHAAAPRGELLDYRVMSIDPGNWIVTAKEIASGDVVKFRLPPTVFKGLTFDANLEGIQKGKRFTARGAQNARLNNLVLEKPGKRGPLNKVKRRGAQIPRLASNPLTWEIMHVDARNWIVEAKNRKTHKKAKFKVHPESFNGFIFRANLQGIGKGKGFSIITPNNQPMNNCCSFLEFIK